MKKVIISQNDYYVHKTTIDFELPPGWEIDTIHQPVIGYSSFNSDLVREWLGVALSHKYKMTIKHLCRRLKANHKEEQNKEMVCKSLSSA